MHVDLVTNKDKLFNPLFYRIRKADKRFVINYGGAGSGKSVSQHQAELLNIVNAKHDTLVIRKHGTDIYDSCFKLFQNIARNFHLYDHFNWVFSNAKREATFIPTGKRIIFKGIDDPDKLKSIVGIRRIMIEEANQLELKDFLEINRRARGIEDIQITLLFNPIDERHWIKAHFFDNEVVRNQTTFFHTTYKDNKFLTDADREQLEQLISISPNDYRIYTLGEWGKPDIQRPYFHNFNADKHTGHSSFMPQYPVIISLDFNLDPFACIMANKWTDAKGDHLHFFHEIELHNGDLQTMATRIKEALPPLVLANALFTGDSTGQSGNIANRDAASNWQTMMKLLNIAPQRLRLPKRNPSPAGMRPLLNLILSTHPDMVFDRNSMKRTIYEMQYTEADAEGNLIKADRNKQEQRADFLDCVRYLLQNFYGDWMKTGQRYLR